MRLDFNVLWIDDLPLAIDSYIKAIARRLIKEGFNFRPTNVTTIDDCIKHLGDDVFRDEVDLVLVDYDLGAGGTGDKALQEIRHVLPYKEIIFYSANAAGSLKRLAFEQDVQGLYCASREDLVDTVVGVFETLIKKILDIDQMRGIVMGATSEIDVLIQDCLLKIGENKEESDNIFKLAQSRIKKSEERSALNYAKALSMNSLPELLADRALSAQPKAILLTEMLSLTPYSHLREQRKMVQEYYSNIIPKRNTLGHARLIAENGTKVFQDREGKTVSSDEMRELRCDLLVHREQFLKLAEALSSKEEEHAKARTFLA